MDIVSEDSPAGSRRRGGRAQGRPAGRSMDRPGAAFLKAKRGKFLLVGIFIAGVIGYLVYAGVRDTRVYYLTPAEVLEMGEEALSGGLRLGGVVQDGSIEWDELELLLKFRVSDAQAAIPVIYRGVVPDTFENGVEIVVEGRYTPEGVFEATVLMPKCPSRYEPAS